MWLVVGLGNPGSKYERTRHNAGFFVLDELASRGGASGWRSKFGGDVVPVQIGSQSVQLLKPMEFMNLSGHAVSRAASFYRIDVPHIVIVHDDIDLDTGAVRLKNGGGHGGHNGLRSIVGQMGTNEFLRVRVGVGRGDAGKEGVVKHVLSDFASGEQELAERATADAADAVATILDRGITSAMNQHNGQSKSRVADRSDSPKTIH